MFQNSDIDDLVCPDIGGRELLRHSLNENPTASPSPREKLHCACLAYGKLNLPHSSTT